MGLFSKDKQTVGYRYRMGMHNILSLGSVDELKEIRFDDEIAWSGSATSNQAISINAPNLFGGDEKEGGVSGTVDFETGAASQIKNTYLQSQLGTDIPAYRGRVGLVFRGGGASGGFFSFFSSAFYFGTTNYLKPLSAVMRRTDTQADYTAQWYIAKARIGDDLNPVHIIRECLVSPVFGLNESTALIDSVSFEAAADICFDEGFGLSFTFDRSEASVSEFLNDIRNIIDCSIYQDLNGKYYIKMIRDDYIVGNLETFGEDEIVQLKDFARPSNSELINDIYINFTDRSNNYSKRVASSANIANINAQGRRVQGSFDYYGIHESDLASIVAARELKQASSALFKCTIIGTRMFLDYNAGDVFILTYPAWGIESVVVRVVSVDYGELSDNKLSINVAEDVFGINNAIYSAPQNSGWVNPEDDPIDNDQAVIMDMPYYELVRFNGEESAQNQPTGTGFGITLVPQIQGQSIGFDTWLDLGGGYSFYRSDSYTPVGVLPDALDDSIANIVTTLSGFAGLSDVEINTPAYYDGEFMKVVAVDAITGDIELARGAIDTVPIAHDAAKPLLFLSTQSYVESPELLAGASFDEKLLIKTSKSTLAIGDATEYSLTVAERFQTPYPPADFVITPTAGDYVTTWKTRTRLNGYAITEQSEAAQTGEAGQTDTLTILDGVTQLRQITGITADTYTYTEAEQRTDVGLIVSGTMTPDVTGAFTETGTNDGKPTYYDGATYYIWWNTANTRWFISTAVGVVPTDGFELVNADPEGTYTALGIYTGSALVAINIPSPLTFQLKSVRSGFDSYTEWEKQI